MIEVTSWIVLCFLTWYYAIKFLSSVTKELEKKNNSDYTP